MDTHHDTPRGLVVLADPVWHALSGYSTFYSSTPHAFNAKTARFPLAAKADTAIVVIDVLRATSTLVAVAAAGAAGIHVAVKTKTGTHPFTPPTAACGPWVYGGEENGRPITGGCIGNSPTEATADKFRNAYLKFVSTNGAKAIAAAEAAGFSRLYLACLPNISSTVAKAIDDEARIALTTAVEFSNAPSLVRALSVSQVGHLLTTIGRGDDINAVVSGVGIDPTVWVRMQTTVLRHTSIEGLGVFVAEPRLPLF
jgi:2-phosphosulfolactate phosphatase